MKSIGSFVKRHQGSIRKISLYPGEHDLEGFENFGISTPAQNPDLGDAENGALNHNNNKINENV